MKVCYLIFRTSELRIRISCNMKYTCKISQVEVSSTSKINNELWIIFNINNIYKTDDTNII